MGFEKNLMGNDIVMQTHKKYMLFPQDLANSFEIWQFSKAFDVVA